VEILRLFRKSKERLVDFCDRCARVCDGGCRAAAIRERALMRALRLGVRA
jgi:radical SAM protein with 4Fe4S-binding SPASM domain